jgi:hypothetical protein
LEGLVKKKDGEANRGTGMRDENENVDADMEL